MNSDNTILIVILILAILYGGEPDLMDNIKIFLEKG